MKNRPHFNKLSKDLIKAVNEAKNDANALVKLIGEMELRKKSKVKLAPTLEKARHLLNEARNTAARVIATKDIRKNRPDFTAEENDQIPSRRAKLGQSSAEQSSVVLETILHPWIGRKLLGGQSLKAKWSDDRMSIEGNGSSTAFDVNGTLKIEVQKHLLSLSVSISDTTQSLKIKGITKKSYENLKVLRLFAEGGRELTKASTDFLALQQLPGYISQRMVTSWFDRHNVLLEAASKIDLRETSVSDQIKAFLDLAANWRTTFEKRNNDYVDRTALQWSSYFEGLESNPLTKRQIEGILRDDDYALIVAGAGTGKTASVVGKIGFLIESKEVKAGDILALAFAKKAAEEMRERVGKRTGHNVEIRTFHSLGRQIVLQVQQEVPVVSDVAADQQSMHALITTIIAKMVRDDDTRSAILNFVAFHRYPAKFLEDFDSKGNYFIYLRKHEPRTLRGELVKSFEELLIADWLTLNGVRYSYEHPYAFKTASRTRRQYKPDFFLSDYNIYLEHFGVGKDGATAPKIDAQDYHAGMEWKRKLHEQHGTKLVETYSWERQDGIILDALERKLKEVGVKISPMSEKSVSELLEQRNINNKLVALLRDFLAVFKEGQWTFEEIEKTASNSTRSETTRSVAFLKIFKPFHDRYERHLTDRQEIDFADLIKMATKYLETGEAKVPFRRIIVDEYQDISRGRQRFLKELIKQGPDVRMMCVGDDWQSIFGFTGSDIRMTTEFSSVFGNFSRIDLDQTFRFTDPILTSSTRFIETNPAQFKKEIHARKPSLEHSVEIVYSNVGEEVDVKLILEMIDQERPSRVSWSVMLLGRYNFSEPKNWETVAKRYKMLDVEFLTVHKSKGLEADVVVVLGMTNGRYGFPGEIPNDPLMGLVLPAEDTFEKAEERRVFYVALTRAKEKVILVSDVSKQSDFVSELEIYPEVFIHGDQSACQRYACPECKTGQLSLVFPNRQNGYAWRCTSHPYCEGKAKICNICGVSPMLAMGLSTGCANAQCQEEKS